MVMACVCNLEMSYIAYTVHRHVASNYNKQNNVNYNNDDNDNDHDDYDDNDENNDVITHRFLDKYGRGERPTSIAENVKLSKTFI